MQFEIGKNIYIVHLVNMWKHDISVTSPCFYVDMDPPDIQFNPQGYLFMATEKGAEQLQKNYEQQR